MQVDQNTRVLKRHSLNNLRSGREAACIYLSPQNPGDDWDGGREPLRPRAVPNTKRHPINAKTVNCPLEVGSYGHSEAVP